MYFHSNELLGMHKFFIVLTIVLLTAPIGWSQIQSGSIEPEKKEEKEESKEEEEKTVVIDGEEYIVKKKKKKKEKKIKEPLSITGRYIYASGAPYWTSSFFEPEYEGQFVNRTEEVPGWAFSSEVGMKVNIKRILQVGVGFGYMQYKQNYTYNAPDSITYDTSYNYQRRHQFIFVPLRINLIHGTAKFKFYYGINVMPGMQLNQSITRNYTTSDGEAVEEQKIVNRNNINSFQLILGGFIGAEYHFSDHISAFVSPEFRYHPFNTNYNLRFTNNLYGFAIRLGVQLQL